jgi:hypothetical protein
MNRIILIVLGVLLSVQVFAQKDDDEKKTKNNKPLARLDQADRIMVDVFTDIWMNAPDDSVMSIRDINRGANAYGMRDIPIGKSNFSFAIGAGISCHNLYSNGIPVREKTFDSTEMIFKYTNKTVFQKIPKGGTINGTEISYKNNKLTVVYIDIPVEIRFRTKNEGQKFKFALGFKVGYMISSHTKYNGNDIRYNYHDNAATQGWDLLSDQKIKAKYYKVPNIESYRLGPTLRIGWGWVNLSAYYSLSSLFKKDKGPDMYPISVGLTITPI